MAPGGEISLEDSHWEHRNGNSKSKCTDSVNLTWGGEELREGSFTHSGKGQSMRTALEFDIIQPRGEWVTRSLGPSTC